ncbi:MAG: hypothetical protein HUJ26_18715 [Planctomycetaceae bacterium]|nr:hypothetical protein [Planctomycetaceae bacterium]
MITECGTPLEEWIRVIISGMQMKTMKTSAAKAGRKRRQTNRNTAPHVPDGEPTPEEIRAVCLEIQSEWSDAERQRRACRGTAVVPHEFQMINSRELEA